MRHSGILVCLIFCFVSFCFIGQAEAVLISAETSGGAGRGSHAAFSFDEKPGTEGTVKAHTEFAKEAGHDPNYPDWSYVISSTAAGNEWGESAVATSFALSAADDSNINSRADLSWENVYTIGTAGNYYWDFAVSGGELEANTGLGAGEGSYTTASYFMEILANDESKWFAGNTVTDNSLTIAPYTGLVDLGFFNDGDALTINYLISVSADGSYPNGVGGAAMAYFGDPDDLSPFGMKGMLTPEPVSALLYGIGLCVFIGRKIKKRKQ